MVTEVIKKEFESKDGSRFDNLLDALSHELITEFEDENTCYAERVLLCDKEEFRDFLYKRRAEILLIFEELEKIT